MTDTTSNPTFDIAKWAAEQRARAAAADAIRPANKAALFATLAAADITSVTVEFDGCGDSGQIESIAAKSGEADADLPDATIALATLGWRDTEPVERTMSIREAIEDMAYDCLARKHGGWEINTGAFGTFKFDLADRSITLAFNRRFEDVESFDHVF